LSRENTPCSERSGPEIVPRGHQFVPDPPLASRACRRRTLRVDPDHRSLRALCFRCAQPRSRRLRIRPCRSHPPEKTVVANFVVAPFSRPSMCHRRGATGLGGRRLRRRHACAAGNSPGPTSPLRCNRPSIEDVWAVKGRISPGVYDRGCSRLPADAVYQPPSSVKGRLAHSRARTRYRAPLTARRHPAGY